jgi:hypothetical protein
MKTSTIAPLALLAFMATLESSSALPAPGLLQRVPVANPSLPFLEPSIGHGPVSIPSTLPPPVVQPLPRDSTTKSPQARTVEIPDTASAVSPPAFQRRGILLCPLTNPQCNGGTSPPSHPIKRLGALICPLGTSLVSEGTCQGTSFPSQPIERREVPICPLTNPQCRGGTSPPGTSIRRRDGIGQMPGAATVASPE